MDTPSIPHIIPVLPLPHLVFFPYTHVSLHVARSFYDRVKDSSWPEDCYLGIVLRKVQPLSQATTLPIGCVGRVVRCHNLPCGRAVHLDLHGLKRFRMREGWFEEGYSQAWIEPIEDQPGNLSPERKRSLLDAFKYLGYTKQLAPEIERHIKAEMNDEVFVNLMCLESNLSPMEKYFLLEAENLNQRCGRLLDLLRFQQEDIWFNRGTCQKDR